jgi:hypothetical protein
MIVTRHHVLRAEIEESEDLRSAILFNETLVSLCNTVRKGSGSSEQGEQQHSQHGRASPVVSRQNTGRGWKFRKHLSVLL